MPNDIEKIYLDTIISKLKSTYDNLKDDITVQDKNYRELQHYIANEKAELDKYELFHQQQELNMIDKRGYAQSLQKGQLEKLIDSPYFGKIAFVYSGEDVDQAENFYIGRFGFSDEDGRILIYDWRAPVSHMYYEFELGEAYYDALGRRYEGNLLSKHQLKIENSNLVYVLDSSLVIQDQVLQQTLTQSSSEHMKSIVNTIQREQNRIVRNDSAHTMVIQGVAGSGKTAVALHRIAYLLYKYREDIQANHIFILSPNKVFSDYISTVLPELGEEPIQSYTLNEVTSMLLPQTITFKSFEEETRNIINDTESDLAKRTAYKTNIAFLEQLLTYLAELDLSILSVKTVSFAGYEFDANYVQTRFMNDVKEPVLNRLQMVAEDIISILQSKRNGELKLPKKKDIIVKLQNLLKFKSPLEVYASFMAKTQPQLFCFDGRTLEFNDVYPYLYCHIYFNGIVKFNDLEYFVLDEMQDYSPIQYAVLSKVFTCRKTLIGDFGQTLLPFTKLSKEVFEKLLSPIYYTELTTSYRSSYEIAMYANKFSQHSKIVPIERHGKQPLVIDYTSEAEMFHLIEQHAVNEFRATAIICKTFEDVEHLIKHLATLTFTVLDEQTRLFRTGIIVTTIQYAKGLEFDSVILPYVNKANYSSEFDKGLLYIATTRAMHHLIVLKDANDNSPLI